MDKISRRKFLRMSALVVGSGVVAACAQATPAPTAAPTKPAAAATATTKPAVAAPTNTTAPAAATATTKPAEPATAVATKPVVAATNTAAAKPAATYKEAPMLAELVKAGKLPPVSERLPQELLVLDPVEKIGKYGGSWSYMELDQTFGSIQLVNWAENFMKFTRETSGYRPDLLTKWSWNAAGTEITLFFRKGIKWSDGQPLTAKDWVWWWNNLVLDDKVKVARPVGSVVGGKDMQLTLVDDYTVKVTFAAPNPTFMAQMCRGTRTRATSMQVIPSHYFQKFHYKFNTALKDTDVKDLLDRFENPQMYPDRPHYGPWIVKESVQGQKCVLERNPYFWKVDTEGNQLPYMDGMQVRTVQTADLISLSCISGEVDFQIRNLATKDVSLLKENEAKGNYKIRMWVQGDSGIANIKIHYCYKDKSIADLFWNQKFRQALALAINRPRIADIVYLGLARPYGIAVLPFGEEFKSPRGQEILKKWESLTTAYDPAKAKALLDEIGVVDKNNDGKREKPDGSPLELILDANVTDKPSVENMQLVTEDWNAIGLKTTLNAIDATVWNNRATACESMLRQRGGSSGGLIIAPAEWAPVEYNEYVLGGPPYGQWYVTGGKQGQEIPAGSWLDKLVKIYNDAVTIVDDAKRNDRILDAYQVHIDEWPLTIGTVGDMKTPVLVKNNLHNVPAIGYVASTTWTWPGTGDPEQWWKD